MLRLAILLFVPILCSSQCLSGYRQTPSGMCVRLNTEALDFNAADNACSDFSTGGRLVSVHTVFDNRFMIDYARNMSMTFVYLGMRDIGQNGTYLWIDGTPVNYLAWCPGYPVNVTQNEYCVIVYLASDECWQNADCSGRNASLCAQGSGTVMTTTATISIPVTTSYVASNCSGGAPGCTAWNQYNGYCYMQCEKKIIRGMKRKHFAKRKVHSWPPSIRQTRTIS